MPAPAPAPARVLVADLTLTQTAPRADVVLHPLPVLNPVHAHAQSLAAFFETPVAAAVVVVAVAAVAAEVAVAVAVVWTAAVAAARFETPRPALLFPVAAVTPWTAAALAAVPAPHAAAARVSAAVAAASTAAAAWLLPIAAAPVPAGLPFLFPFPPQPQSLEKGSPPAVILPWAVLPIYYFAVAVADAADDDAGDETRHLVEDCVASYYQLALPCVALDVVNVVIEGAAGRAAWRLMEAWAKNAGKVDD
jgi:hypothetical protein